MWVQYLSHSMCFYMPVCLFTAYQLAREQGKNFGDDIASAIRIAKRQVGGHFHAFISTLVHYKVTMYTYSMTPYGLLYANTSIFLHTVPTLCVKAILSEECVSFELALAVCIQGHILTSNSYFMCAYVCACTVAFTVLWPHSGDMSTVVHCIVLYYPCSLCRGGSAWRIRGWPKSQNFSPSF